jgi:hypothetical protein
MGLVVPGFTFSVGQIVEYIRRSAGPWFAWDLGVWSCFTLFLRMAVPIFAGHPLPEGQAGGARHRSPNRGAPTPAPSSNHGHQLTAEDARRRAGARRLQGMRLTGSGPHGRTSCSPLSRSNLCPLSLRNCLRLGALSEAEFAHPWPRRRPEEGFTILFILLRHITRPFLTCVALPTRPRELWGFRLRGRCGNLGSHALGIATDNTIRPSAGWQMRSGTVEMPHGCADFGSVQPHCQCRAVHHFRLPWRQCL